MIVDQLATFFLIFAIIWFFGGLAFFGWLFNTRILRFIKKTNTLILLLIKKTKVIAKDLGWTALLLAPFSIPIVVTAICLYFAPK